MSATTSSREEQTEVAWDIQTINPNDPSDVALHALESAATAAMDFNQHFASLRDVEREATIPKFAGEEVIRGRNPLRYLNYFCEFELRGIRVVLDFSQAEGFEDHGPRARLAERSIDGHYSVKYLQEYLVESDHAINAVTEMILEAKVLMNLAPHPNLCQIYGVNGGGVDAFLHPGKNSFFVITDRLRDTLQDRLHVWRKMQQSKNIPEKTKLAKLNQRLEVALDIASALVYLHSRELVFYLRPDKVAFDDRYGRVKMHSFGQVRMEGMTSHPKGVTKSDDMTCLAYTSPEVLCRGTATQAVDVYAFGVMLWELVTLAVPFLYLNRGKHYERVVCQNERPPLTDTDCPTPQLRELIEACWNPRRRPKMRHVHQKLEGILLCLGENEVLDSPPLTAPQTPQPQKQSLQDAASRSVGDAKTKKASAMTNDDNDDDDDDDASLPSLYLDVSTSSSATTKRKRLKIRTIRTSGHHHHHNADRNLLETPAEEEEESEETMRSGSFRLESTSGSVATQPTSSLLRSASFSSRNERMIRSVMKKLGSTGDVVSVATVPTTPNGSTSSVQMASPSRTTSSDRHATTTSSPKHRKSHRKEGRSSEERRSKSRERSHKSGGESRSRSVERHGRDDRERSKSRSVSRSVNRHQSAGALRTTKDMPQGSDQDHDGDHDHHHGNESDEGRCTDSPKSEKQQRRRLPHAESRRSVSDKSHISSREGRETRDKNGSRESTEYVQPCPASPETGSTGRGESVEGSPRAPTTPNPTTPRKKHHHGSETSSTATPSQQRTPGRPPTPKKSPAGVIKHPHTHRSKTASDSPLRDTRASSPARDKSSVSGRSRSSSSTEEGIADPYIHEKTTGVADSNDPNSPRRISRGVREKSSSSPRKEEKKPPRTSSRRSSRSPSTSRRDKMERSISLRKVDSLKSPRVSTREREPPKSATGPGYSTRRLSM